MNQYFKIREIIKYKWGLGIGDWGLGPIPNPLIQYKFKFSLMSK